MLYIGYNDCLYMFNFIDLQKKAGQQKEMTFQDMYNQDLDDDDDDSDWEPLQKHVEIVRWFCTNCTMVNLGDVVHCDVSYFSQGCWDAILAFI